MTDAPPPILPPTRSPTPPPAPAKGDELLRQVALGAVVVVATLIVLIGLSAVVLRAAPAASPSAPAVAATLPPTTGRPSPAPSSSPSASPSGDAASTPPSASPSDPVVDPVLVGAGDIANCTSPGDEATARLLDEIEGTVFTAGDNVYDRGTLATFRECYEPSWGRHKDRTHPAPGNHDWDDPDLAGYLAYFGDAAAPDGTSWYSYDLGTWHVVVLDSECEKAGGCDPDSEQGRWLADDLAASDTSCTVAIFHHPRFSSGEHGNIRAVAPLWDALHAAGTDVIVNGHDHDYERFAPQDPDGREDRARGIRQFVVGTGGTPLRAFADAQPNSELRASITHGVLALTLREGGYGWRFHATDGRFSDEGTATCH
jgi:hypothetical protein